MTTQPKTKDNTMNDRIEIFTWENGEARYLLNEAGTVRIANLGEWITTTQEGWSPNVTNVVDWSAVEEEWTNDYTEWVKRTEAVAAVMVAA